MSGKRKQNKEQLYKYTRVEFIQSVVENGGFASGIQYLNDPYESYGISHRDNFRIVSLTRSRDAKLMWSHYANGHRGCLIKIKTPKDYYEENYPLRRVTYSSTFSDRTILSDEEIVEN